MPLMQMIRIRRKQLMPLTMRMQRAVKYGKTDMEERDGKALN